MVLTRKVLLPERFIRSARHYIHSSCRATGLKHSADVVEMDGDRVLRSQHFVFPAPSVIRLIEYIDVRGRQGRSSTKRSRILMRDRHRCQYCGTRGNGFELTIDHIVPRSRGGRTTADNLCAACFAMQSAQGRPDS